MKVNRPGGVRRYLRRTLRQRCRQFWTLRGVATAGAGVFVEDDVHVMRHPERLHLGAQVILKAGARICPTNPDARIQIGDWTTIGYQTFLFATTSITVGANCLIAPFCYVVDANHGIRRGMLIREQDMSAAPITIGDDVWLGTGAIVLKGVTIGPGAVVGAGAVVTGDIPAYAIAAGNPAVVVDERR